MNAYLAVSGVNKSFGGLQALHDTNFEIAKGKITCLVGPNGAGKTTIFNVITGFLAPDTGGVTFQGTGVQFSSDAQVVKDAISLLKQRNPNTKVGGRRE